MDNSSHITIKINEFCIDFTGSEEFIESRLIGIIKEVIDLKFNNALSTSESPIIETTTASGQGDLPRSPGITNLGLNSYISVLGATNGRSLVVTSASYLAIENGIDAFTREQLLTTMKGATGIYNLNDSKNLSNYLKGLVKSKEFNDIGAGKFSLSRKLLAENKAKIDEHKQQ